MFNQFNNFELGKQSQATIEGGTSRSAEFDGKGKPDYAGTGRRKGFEGTGKPDYAGSGKVKEDMIDEMIAIDPLEIIEMPQG